MEEHNQQVMFFKFIGMLEKHHPSLRLIFAVPNAGRRGRMMRNGRWYSIEGKFLKDEGMKRGVPDILFPVRSKDGAYIGLAIEMKSQNGRLTPEQKWWLDELAEHGWMTGVCRSWIEAANLTMRYLCGDDWQEIE